MITLFKNATQQCMVHHPKLLLLVDQNMRFVFNKFAKQQNQSTQLSRHGLLDGLIIVRVARLRYSCHATAYRDESDRIIYPNEP